ncbi:MAG: 4Fe-4S binding protein [Candidatus Anammoxibacter sp.]
MDSKKTLIGIENNLEIAVDQKVEMNASVGVDVSVGVKPVSVETSFESKLEITTPEFTAGTSGFSLTLFGIPLFFKSCYIGTEGGIEQGMEEDTDHETEDLFAGLLFGEGITCRLPAYKITDKCIGCSTCARQCPTGAISGVKKKRFNINPFQCILCGTCGRACPVAAIVDQNGEKVERVKPKEKKVPVVIEELCSGCENCVNICPFQCLSIKEDGSTETVKGVSFLEKKAKCVACGECERICRQDAIVLQDPVTEPDKQVA